MRALGVCLCLALLLAAAAGPVAVNYVDVAKPAGLTERITFGGETKNTYILETTGTGAAVFDFDGDGLDDIFIANGAVLDRPGHTGTRSYLYRNVGGGKFTEIGAEAGLLKEGWAQGACAADYDNDGRTDLLVTYYGSNVLYRNLGAGKFADITATAKLPTTGTRWGAGCAFVDYDLDGYVDLFVSNYIDLDLAKTPKPGADTNCQWKGLAVMCGPRGLPTAHNALYHNNRDGTFTDVSESAGILKPGGRYGLGVVAADFDNDGWPDIYVACDMTPSLLYRNRGDGTFEERAVQAGVAYNFDGRAQAGMGVAVADFDGNGYFDLVKTNFSGDLPSLYKNEDGKFFSDVSQRSGLGANQLLGWGVAFIDVDEDGWKDIIMTNGHVYPEVDAANVGERYRQKTLLYRNLGNGRFADITAQAGPALRDLRAGRGLATGDFDGDGHPEIVIVNMNDRPSLLKNTGARGKAIAVRLVGTRSNRSAIGARVEVTTGGRTQIDEVRSGGSYYSQNSLTLHFGLGNADAVEKLLVRWPGGGQQEWKVVPAGNTVIITENSVELKMERFGSKSPAK